MSSNEESQQVAKDHFFHDTPVNVAIEALQRQVDQLKRIVNLKSHQISQLGHDSGDVNAGNKLDENIKALIMENNKLRIANDKAEYRIKMLLRALEERDNNVQNK